MANILVTGGAGYIGSITTRHLLVSGHHVRVVDDLSRGHAQNIPANILTPLRLHDTAQLVELLDGVDAVIHFAAYIAVGESTREPELYFSNNIGASLSLFDAMNTAKVRRLVFSSTAAVYGNPRIVPIPETEPFVPVSPYGETKTTIERLLSELDRYRGLRSITLRYFNACGGEPEHNLGEQHDPETHLIPLLLRAISTGEPIQIFGDDYPTSDGTCIRDYIHVSDLAEAHLASVDHLLGGGGSDAFNVGTGSGFTVMEVLREVEHVTGEKVPYRLAPRREGDAASLVADSTKLRKSLGWQPRRSSLHQIIKDSWNFHQRTARGVLSGFQ